MCIELDFKDLYSFNPKALFDRNEYSFFFISQNPIPYSIMEIGFEYSFGNEIRIFIWVLKIKLKESLKPSFWGIILNVKFSRWVLVYVK